MRGYSIEARSLNILGVAGHNYWVLRDEHGHALAQLHGLATERRTGQAVPIGTNQARHSLRAWHYPHDAAYAKSIGAPVNRTSFIRDNQPSCTVIIGDKDEILARWNTAVNAVSAFNAQDLNYPNYGFNLLRDTVNSNSAYRTFGELMNVSVPGFPGRFEPGIGNRILSPERTEALRYCAPATPPQTPRSRPPSRSRLGIITFVALLLALLLFKGIKLDA
ncbi:hypothetical protein PS3A_57850 [Pseudomonas sp. 3A(2025)]